MRSSRLVPTVVLTAGLCLSAVAAAGRRPAAERPRDLARPTLESQAVSAPVIERGGTAVLALDGHGRPALRRLEPGAAAGETSFPTAAATAGLRPVLRRTAEGGLRAAWIEETAGGGRVLVGRVESGETVLLHAGPAAPLGITAMDYAVDRAGRDWAAWAEHGTAGAGIRVCDFGAGRTWLIASPSGRSVIAISLDAGPDGRLWLVWTAAGPGPDRLFASDCDGGAWTPALEIGGGAATPCLFPRVRTGASGIAWAVWSAHDGRDYEILAARASGGTWSAPVRLTDNGVDDLCPALAFGPGDRPMAVYASGGPAAGAVCAAFADGEGGEMRLAGRSAPGLLRPEAAWGDDGLAVAWFEGGRLRTWRWPDAGRPGTLQPPADGRFGGPPVSPLAALDDDVFIGFGDSITYGTINHVYEPELGYLPRLQARLEPYYGPVTMVNEGWPGEITINGMGRLDDVLAARRGRTLLLMEGTNDVSFLEISMEATAFHLEQMIQKCRRAGVFPVLATIIPRNDWRWERPIYRDRIDALNGHIRRLAVNLNIPLVDMFEVFYNYAAGGSDWNALISDGVHPSDTGYEVMTEAWFSEVRIAPWPALYVTLRPAVERALLSSRRVNVLSWQHNPKLGDPAHFARYRIYRRDLDRFDAGYELIAALPLSTFNRPQTYIDLEASGSRRYGYAVTLVRLDGVEGASSNPTND